jgi:hypothetical protein
MAFFKKGSDNRYTEAKLQLEDAINMGRFGDKQTAKDAAEFVSLETVGAETLGRLANVEQDIESTFMSAQIEELLYNAAGWTEGADKSKFKHTVEQAQKAMTFMAMASADPKAYMAKFYNPAKAPSDVVVFGSEAHSDQVISMEGFDTFNFNEFRAQSILSAGLTMATSPFQSLFKPVVIPASQSGLDIVVRLPQIYGRTFRPDNGAQWNLEKHSLVKAMLDHTILEANSTKIVAVAQASNDAFLVPAAKVANRTVKVGTTEVATRPIKYGVKVNLINISNHAGVKATGTQNETDTLDPFISLGHQNIEIVNGGNSGVFVADISRHAGALLNIAPEGRDPNRSTSFEGAVWVSHDSLLANGATVEATLGLGALLGLAANVPYRAKLNMRLHGTVEFTDGNMQVDFIHAKWGEAYTGADFAVKVDSASAEYQALVTTATLAGLGFDPEAQRSNSNMRDLGTIVDPGTDYKFRLSVPMEAPISSVKPVTNLGAGVSMDTLSAVKRLRNYGTAATTLLNFEKRLIATQGMKESLTAIGDILVEATYLRRQIDVTSAVRTINSATGMADLQNQIVNALAMQANEILLDSAYRNALHVYTGNANNFEVNLITDPLVANLIMTQGDGRTLGNQRRFSITEVEDRRFRNRVYITFSRTDVAGADPLNFGCHLSAPSLIYQATTTKGGAVAGETQMIPREKFYVTLPILGRLDIVGLEGYFHNMNPTP